MAAGTLVSIDAKDRTPIYAQLDRGLRAAIATGRLQVGDQLPTVRQLAVDLSINANTVARLRRARAGRRHRDAARHRLVRHRHAATGATAGPSPSSAARVRHARDRGRGRRWIQHRRCRRRDARASSEGSMTVAFRSRRTQLQRGRAAREHRRDSDSVRLGRDRRPAVGARGQSDPRSSSCAPIGALPMQSPRVAQQWERAVVLRLGSSSACAAPACSGSSRSSTPSRRGSISAPSRPASRRRRR